MGNLKKDPKNIADSTKDAIDAIEVNYEKNYEINEVPKFQYQT